MVHSRRRRRKQMAEMNVVPYIDVMLVLLVIFMVTAPMLKTGVEVNLPGADAAPINVSAKHEPLNVIVDNLGLFYLDDSGELSREELISKIVDKLQQVPDQVVHIRGDQGVQYDHVMQAMTAIKQAGIKNLGLIVIPKTASE